VKARNVLMNIIVRSLSVCCRSICYGANEQESNEALSFLRT